MNDQATKTTLQAPVDGVTVRMYRVGLGDCFLLAFPTGQPGQSYYVMIDCGVFPGSPGGADRIRASVQDIKAVTGGHIHLLVVTHRHADHISGFTQAAEIFKDLHIHNLWLSWTERPEDGVADPLWKRAKQALAGLTQAASMRPESPTMQRVAGVLEFMGELGAAAKGDPLDPVRQLAAGGNIKYCEPGEGPLSLPGTSGASGTSSASGTAASGSVPSPTGIHLYVLGPPKNTDFLTQMDPDKGSNETYLAAGGTGSQLVFLLSALAPAALTDEEMAMGGELSYPFERNVRMTPEQAAELDFFRENYGFAEPAQATGEAPAQAAAARRSSAARGEDNAPAWRRIDDDWTATAEALALHLDNYVNNTSVALAFELDKSKKVLLFVGDAQVGNWLSWHDLEWPRPGKSTLKAADLLARTVFYKVGHHGSQNATVRQYKDDKWGLELMTSPELTAMIPVNKQFAQGVRKWRMPYTDLLERLEFLAAQRIIQADDGVPTAPPPGIDDTRWAAFRAATEQTDLYVQYTIRD
jgi:hypothetical protein